MANLTNKKDPVDQLVDTVTFLLDVFHEFLAGIWMGTLPWLQCSIWGIAVGILCIFDFDFLLWSKIGVAKWYPDALVDRSIYISILMCSGFIMWAIYRAAVKMGLMRRLTSTFQSISLKNSLGQLPQFIKDEPLDAQTRRLRLTKRCLPMERFQAAKSALESSLQIFIDDMKDNRKSGTIDIIYAKEPMPENILLEEMQIKPGSLIVGETRSGPLTTDFNATPHLLVAGQTGGGKSTCIRQWITTLYVSNPSYEFTLIDLKGGLEFQTFENLPRLKVNGSVSLAVDQLCTFEEEIERRMKILKQAEVKDLDGLHQKIAKAIKTQGESPKVQTFYRHIIVVDEAAELFLSGGDVSSKEAQKARVVISKIARQGRAVGLNLIIGTQRPDSNALDSQVKANLIGKICFQMSDQYSSQVVLGNARARDLPAVAGRAIWQNGMQQIEIQVPYLSIERAEQILKPHRIISEVGGNKNDESREDL
ncbi:MAG: FtsK/SpoIIIE domain-containing protein [Proteobacteria bacterium]|nr:FtsK/SpoIIIE domain-containing protein [Pseudomonadota bacterium]